MTEGRQVLMAELSSPEALLNAVRSLRDGGHRSLAAYTPHPVAEVERALGHTWSVIPYVVLAVGLATALGSFGLQVYLNDINYPINIGGFPVDTMFAFVPITFEGMVLGAVVTAFVSVLVAAGLPMLWHPVFEVPGFESASIDGYWLAVPVTGDDHALRAQLAALGAVTVADAIVEKP